MSFVSDIAIVGAGFSGCATAIQLLRRSMMPLHITLLERRPEVGTGVAYGTESPAHILNVPAGRMSLFEEDDDDFLRFARSHHGDAAAGSFLPRSLYGNYLRSRLEQSAVGGRATLRTINGDAVALRPPARGQQARLYLADGRTLEAERVVLATGSGTPANPAVQGAALYDSTCYVRDPWRPGALEGVRPELPVFIIGTGLSMVDIILELRRRGLRGPIHALSRRGLLPQAHARAGGDWNASALIRDLLEGPATVSGYLRIVREHVRAAKQNHVNWREVIAALRPVTPELWQRFDPLNRRRFLRHLQPYWETHRHRMAESSQRLIMRDIKRGRLVCHAGCLVSLGETESGRVGVHWRPRGRSDTGYLEVGTVINCTGSSSNAVWRDPLLQALRVQGLVTPDPVGLGPQTDEKGALMDLSGRTSDWLYYVGPLLRGQFWECTAVPELRIRARMLALHLAAQAYAFRRRDSATALARQGG